MGVGSSYLRRRALELASPATRATTDPLGDWAVRRIRLDGRPFRFEGHEYLRAIYNDTAPHIVLSKAAQIGGTTWAILRALHACLNGLNVMYFFPTRTDVLEFSKSRVGPLLGDNPFLAKHLRDTDTAGLKRIGDAHLYMRGMQSSVGMKSVPADMIIFDELDEATPDARAMAWERIAHSDYKRVIELSNPSLHNYGIDEQYEKSDQRHWTLKCPKCGQWTALEKEFPRKLGQKVTIIRQADDGTYYRACPKCGAELDVDKGEWVPDFPGRPIHGYRISQLFSLKVDPGEIMEEYRTTRFPDRFYNLKIGIPWADLERRVDPATVLSLLTTITDYQPREHYFTMGVDTGKQLHIVILRWDWDHKGKLDLIQLAIESRFEALDWYMKRFDISKCVIDGLPETHAARRFAKRHYGQVFLNFFNENQRGKPKFDTEEWKVEINRTEALDDSRTVIREKKINLSRDAKYIQEFAHHMAADAKILEENEETGAKKYRYIRTGEDHFSLAFTYALMAARRVYPIVVV
jgi:hypothetical protein